MITTPQTAELPAIKGNNILVKSTGDDLMEFKVGDETSLVSRKDLYSLVFALGDNVTQDALMPVRQTKVHKYIKQHRVKVKKHLKPGDEVVVNCEIDVPITIEDGLKGLVNRVKSRFAL